MKEIKAAIKVIRSHLPSAKLTSDQLGQEYADWDAAKILDKTGISERRVVWPGECASDLGVAAAQKP